MGNIDSLIGYLEELDGQLAPVGTTIDAVDTKLIKEILLTRQKVRQLAQRDTHIPLDSPLRGKVEKVISGNGYNIDSLNDSYRDCIACPRCSTTDVAVVRKASAPRDDFSFDLHQNRRLKLVYSHVPSPSARFSCNKCLTSFNPSLPPHTVRLCELLFTYYH